MRALVFWRLFLLMPLSLLCVSADAETAGPAKLKERVVARWQAITAHEFGDTYPYESPLYRKAFPKKLHVNKFSSATLWDMKELASITHDPVHGTAIVVVDVKTQSALENVDSFPDGGVAQVKITERWRKVKRDWYHVSSN